MHRSTVALPILLVVAAPAAAQLTPEQRAAVEHRPNAEKSVTFYKAIEDRALNGDATAWFGAVARESNRQTAEEFRARRRPFEPGGIWLAPGTARNGNAAPAAESRDHWFTIGQRAGTPRELRRAPVGQVDVRADIPLALTLASPIGAPGRSLMIRTVVGQERSPGTWARMGEITPDAHGNYRVEIPALHAGTYDLQIEVYDPETPEAPYSSSRSTLIAWVP